MKTFLTITLLLLLTTLSKSQDASLPQGKSRIFLYSGKIIKNVRLWNIDSEKAEYVLNGNLADAMISEIQKIETPDYVLTFDEKNQPVKKHYDFIFLKSGDTIRCFIQQTSEWYITYLAAENGKLKSIGKSSYDSYHIEQKPVVETKTDSSEYKKIEKQPEFALSDSSPNNPEGKNKSDTLRSMARTGKDSLYDYYHKNVKETTSLPVKTDSNSAINTNEKKYYEMGKNDGQKYYSGNGNAVGAFCCGIIPIYGWLGGIVLFATPPPYNTDNPNNALIYTNEDYKNGYKETAGKQKRKKVAAGFTLGLGTLFVIAFGASN